MFTFFFKCIRVGIKTEKNISVLSEFVVVIVVLLTVVVSSISIQLTLSYSPPGYAVMLSGKRYWKFDPVELTVLAGYPRSIGQDFFGCAAHQAIHPFFI